MILITGATGTNGRLVARALLGAAARVRAMVQDRSRAAALERAGAELVVADFDRPDTLDTALAGVERGLLLSAVDQRLVHRWRGSLRDSQPTTRQTRDAQVRSLLRDGGASYGVG